MTTPDFTISMGDRRAGITDLRASTERGPVYGRFLAHLAWYTYVNLEYELRTSLNSRPT
ncbi:MAG: hypothetical protein ACRD2N_01050 [Vicinamibacterales bacterium]